MAGEPVPPGVSVASSVPWKDPKFYHGVETVRQMCNVPKADREDDALIGMMLDRFKWDYAKASEMYKTSVLRRQQLGLSQIKEEIVSRQLALEDFPHHRDVMPVIPIFASHSLEAPPAAAGGTAGGSGAPAAGKPPPVIGCYMFSYGQGDPASKEESLVAPANFTKYMLYVTQWRQATG